MAPVSDDDFARAFAPLLEVMQRGKMRPATPNDVLELLCGNNGRYIVKRGEHYLGDNGIGWTRKQREALVIPDHDAALSALAMGREQGIEVRLVRLRRYGTLGLEAVRIRPDIAVQVDSGEIRFDVGGEEGMRMLEILTKAKVATGEQ
jgi:hypothetical protein